MRFWLAEMPLGQLGLVMTRSPQKSGVVPQKPNWLQQTLSGHVSLKTYRGPQPAGSHSALASQLLTQTSAAQKSKRTKYDLSAQGYE